MITKLLEIRDRNTFIPAIAIAMLPGRGYPENGTITEEELKAGLDALHARRYLLRRCGYAEDERHPTIAMGRLDAGLHRPREFCADPYDWCDRTFQVAHIWITEHWHDLKDGDVVDVEFILGERAERKVSERIEHLESGGAP